MFKFFRKNIKLFIWLIVLAFVIWGAGSSITALIGQSSSYAGKVGKERISQKEFLMLFRFYELLAQTPPPETKAAIPSQNTDQKGKEQTPKPVEAAKDPPKQPSYDEIKSMVWQTIILNQEAKKRGLRVTDEEVADEIRKQFSGGGNNFVREIYENWVQRNFRGEPRDFEEAFRRHLMLQKMRGQILAGIPEAEREKHWTEFLIPLLTNTKFTDYTAKSKS